MCRRSTKAEILALLAKLRDRLPGLVLRTSLICGLPGEGEAEFEELCHFLREQRKNRRKRLNAPSVKPKKAVMMSLFWTLPVGCILTKT